MIKRSKQKRPQTLSARVAMWWKRNQTWMVKKALAEVGVSLFPTSKLKRYFVNRGDGRAVIAYVSGDEPDEVELIFQRKVTGEDFVERKLQPTSFSLVNRRGKRITGIRVPLASVEDLHRLLGQVLNDRERPGRNISMMAIFAHMQAVSDLSKVSQHVQEGG
jgi:hypothetical protein